MKLTDIDEIKALTLQIINRTFTEGDYELWYSCFFRDSVLICTAEPMLIGDVAIRAHFDSIPKVKSAILDIECTAQKIGDSGAVVFGHYVLGTEQSAVFATVFFSVTYVYLNGKPKILLENLHYDFHVQKENGGNEALAIDLNTVDFVRTLLLHIGGSRIEVKSGAQVVFIDPATILYVDSRRNKSEIVCVDRNVSCNQSIEEVKRLLPDYFYPLRRGNLVNLNYVVSIRRFELEMISGIKIPIPERNYPQVKNEISARISSFNPRKKLS